LNDEGLIIGRAISGIRRRPKTASIL